MIEYEQEKKAKELAAQLRMAAIGARPAGGGGGNGSRSRTRPSSATTRSASTSRSGTTTPTAAVKVLRDDHDNRPVGPGISSMSTRTITSEVATQSTSSRHDGNDDRWAAARTPSSRLPANGSGQLDDEPTSDRPRTVNPLPKRV
jgi:hypothetical protein